MTGAAKRVGEKSQRNGPLNTGERSNRRNGTARQNERLKTHKTDICLLCQVFLEKDCGRLSTIKRRIFFLVTDTINVNCINTMSDIHIFQAQLAGLTQLANRAPGAWRKAHPDSTFQVVHPENYLGFVSHDIE